MTDSTAPTKHGGILIPLDPFRISHMAAVAAELLVSKARNINDARLVLTRHPQTPLVLARIEGTVIDDDPCAFWRENADIVVAMSQVLPRQCFMYYVQSAPPAERREAFLVAQRGQVIAAEEGTADRQKPGDERWPVEDLCHQLRLSVDELARGFEGGPSVEVQLLEPGVDDQALLMILAGQGPADGPDGPDDEPDNGTETVGAEPAKKAAPAPAKPKLSVADDLKRRETERAADDAAQQQRAQEVRSDLPIAIDELGIVACPKAELSEPDILAPFIVGKISGDLPSGLPSKHADALQGKRSDVALRVDFFSEVFVDSAPLSRQIFDERAQVRSFGGRELRVLEVLAPRLGYGTFISTGKGPHVFVSRKPELALPEALILDLLG